jgi:hypothetical protein
MILQRYGISTIFASFSQNYLEVSEKVFIFAALNESSTEEGAS